LHWIFEVSLARAVGKSWVRWQAEACGVNMVEAFGLNVEVRALVFEYSIRDFFEAQNIVEACWFQAFFTQFCEVFEGEKFGHVEFFMLVWECLCLSKTSVDS
jgi:hypothetical protein